MPKHTTPIAEVKHVFACGSTQVRVMADGTARFHYRLDGGDDGSCEFSLLSEVGEHYRRKFDVIFDAYEMKFAEHPAKLAEAPWYADRVTSVDGEAWV